MHPAHSHYSGQGFPGGHHGPMMPGLPIYPVPMGHGFCHGCGHPKSKCVCGCRECRKESKELLVKADQKIGDVRQTPGFAQMMSAQAQAPIVMNLQTAGFQTANVAGRETLALDAAAAALQAGIGTAFIGGGCCVHLSIEYMPTSPTAQSLVAVLVQDSDGTLLAWARTEKAGIGYQIKECIITTKPGATVTVLVVNMTARLRWCEVFSC
ncbi:MAG TPA: hypothetical protein VHA10_25290 [Hypericibacter adhaerens]|jgi:hypothetical protein|uniref:hypothetical protein n=1 Tax=Hypericibacter adhaerens TaxID=2602016 RepID=UPI002C3A33B8|nr:hypothetical protein [Hypericibacter adhaerens]HWA46558.1 hypothetical protein [Hypericibacter adhaerens]